jgi:hypothetical protein
MIGFVVLIQFHRVAERVIPGRSEEPVNETSKAVKATIGEGWFVLRGRGGASTLGPM